MSTTLEEIGSNIVGSGFQLNRQVTAGAGNNRSIFRTYKIRVADITSYTQPILNPVLYDTTYPFAVLVDQRIQELPGNKVDAHLIREFAEIPTSYDDPDDRVVTFPGVALSSLYAAGDFNFRSAQASLRTDVRVRHDYFLADPKTISRYHKFFVYTSDGLQTTVVTDYTLPSCDEYIAAVAGRQELIIDCQINQWKGWIHDRVTTFAQAR